MTLIPQNPIEKTIEELLDENKDLKDENDDLEFRINKLECGLESQGLLIEDLVNNITVKLINQDGEINEKKVIEKMGNARSIDPEEITSMISKTQEFLETGGAEAKKKMNRVLDFNKDGKVDKADFKDFLKTVGYFTLIVWAILLTREKDNIWAFIESGNWVGLASFLETAIFLQGVIIVISFFYESFKKRWLEDDKKVKEAEEKAKAELEARMKIEQEKKLQEIRFAFDLIKKEYNIIDANMSAESKAAIARVLCLQLDEAQSVINEMKASTPTVQPPVKTDVVLPGIK